MNNRHKMILFCLSFAKIHIFCNYRIPTQGLGVEHLTIYIVYTENIYHAYPTLSERSDSTTVSALRIDEFYIFSNICLKIRLKGNLSFNKVLRKSVRTN